MSPTLRSAEEFKIALLKGNEVRLTVSSSLTSIPLLILTPGERLRSHERSRSCSVSRRSPSCSTPPRTQDDSKLHDSPMPFQSAFDQNQAQTLSDAGMVDFGNPAFGDMPLLAQPFTHADMVFNWSDGDIPPPLDMNSVSSIDSMGTSALLGNSLPNNLPMGTVAPVNMMPDMTDDVMRRISESTIDDGKQPPPLTILPPANNHPARKRSWSVDTMPTWPCTSPPDSLLNDSTVPSSKLETKIDTAISSLVKLYESGVYLDMLKEDPSLTNDLETIRQRIRLNASNSKPH